MRRFVSKDDWNLMFNRWKPFLRHFTTLQNICEHNLCLLNRPASLCPPPGCPSYWSWCSCGFSCISPLWEIRWASRVDPYTCRSYCRPSSTHAPTENRLLSIKGTYRICSIPDCLPILLSHHQGRLSLCLSLCLGSSLYLVFCEGKWLAGALWPVASLIYLLHGKFLSPDQILLGTKVLGICSHPKVLPVLSLSLT